MGTKVTNTFVNAIVGCAICLISSAAYSSSLNEDYKASWGLYDQGKYKEAISKIVSHYDKWDEYNDTGKVAISEILATSYYRLGKHEEANNVAMRLASVAGGLFFSLQSMGNIKINDGNDEVRDNIFMWPVFVSKNDPIIYLATNYDANVTIKFEHGDKKSVSNTAYSSVQGESSNSVDNIETSFNVANKYKSGIQLTKGKGVFLSKIQAGDENVSADESSGGGFFKMLQAAMGNVDITTLLVGRGSNMAQEQFNYEVVYAGGYRPTINALMIKVPYIKIGNKEYENFTLMRYAKKGHEAVVN